MSEDLSGKNKSYWQNYRPGEVPSVPASPPRELLNEIAGPILDVGTGDGKLAEELSFRGIEVFAIDVAKNLIEENKSRRSAVIYSVQDITEKTNFPDNYFDLLIFKFVLTNIHKESWSSLGMETTRVLKPGGRIWILEPLVSDSYESRYRLASNFLTDSHCVYVFKDKELAAQIDTPGKLRKAIEDNQVSRIVKHYTVEELISIFANQNLINTRQISVTSPSGFSINTFEGVFVK